MDPSDVLPPPEARSRETAIRRDAQGRWWNAGEAIAHPLLTRAFDGWIERADDGRYCLKNDVNWAYVAIEGAPYFVRSVRLGPSSAEIELSGGSSESLDPSTLFEGPDGALYCRVRKGRFVARLDAHAAMQLGDALEDDASADGAVKDGAASEGGEPTGRPVLRIGGARVRPPVVADPLSAE